MSEAMQTEQTITVDIHDGATLTDVVEVTNAAGGSVRIKRANGMCLFKSEPFTIKA